jgi:hypothetical protein
MKDLFRIRPVAPDQYIIERKGWVFWWTIKEGRYDMTWPKEFDSKESAMDFIDNLLVKEERTREHLAQLVAEYP